MNTNPNFGVTNFDTILYSLLLIFQSVTLEGWSEFMKQIMKSNSVIFGVVFFVPIVFVGSFFLLNLTLAVIKS